MILWLFLRHGWNVRTQGDIYLCMHYFVGLHINNETSRWTYESKEVSLNEVYGENGQPDKAQGICIYATKNGYFSFGNCLSKLPFICKSHAVLEGKTVERKFNLMLF